MIIILCGWFSTPGVANTDPIIKCQKLALQYLSLCIQALPSHGHLHILVTLLQQTEMCFDGVRHFVPIVR